VFRYKATVRSPDGGHSHAHTCLCILHVRRGTARLGSEYLGLQLAWSVRGVLSTPNADGVTYLSLTLLCTVTPAIFRITTQSITTVINKRCPGNNFTPIILKLKNGVFWDVTACGCCKNGRFGGTSETSILITATRRNIPEDTILHSHGRENLNLTSLNCLFSPGGILPVINLTKCP
jgi:hypothetical protein